MLSTVFNKNKGYFATRTFTFFLPSPPQRKTGYQEKEFDGHILEIAKLGFDIIDIKTASLNTSERSGLWVVCLLGAKTQEIFNKTIAIKSSDMSTINAEEVPMDPDIIHD